MLTQEEKTKLHGMVQNAIEQAKVIEKAMGLVHAQPVLSLAAVVHVLIEAFETHVLNEAFETHVLNEALETKK